MRMYTHRRTSRRSLEGGGGGGEGGGGGSKSDECGGFKAKAMNVVDAGRDRTSRRGRWCLNVGMFCAELRTLFFLSKVCVCV